MARGPFQGTFQPNARATVTTAPDALVYFNGEAEIVGCPECIRKFDFNKYVTSIQTDLSVDSAPGSASISLAVPRHSIDDFYFDGNPVICPMMEVEIFAKGYYLVEGLPQYYPVFWGLVTEVGDAYSNGEHTVSIQCADILKWWELCQMNVNPALTSVSSQQGMSLSGNNFTQMNPYDIIFTLAQQSLGDVIAVTGSLSTLMREATDPQRFNAALGDMMLFWQKRFAKVRSNLVLYGASGVAVRGDTIMQKYYRPDGVSVDTHAASTAVRDAGGPDGGQLVLDVTSPAVTPFRLMYGNLGVNAWQAEFQTKLELANAAKESIGFEFYMDVTGDIVFKPPFYNLDVLGNKPISWIQDIDIIDWDFSESESEVVTHIQMKGVFGGDKDIGASDKISPLTSVTDYHLLRKYGWRTHPYNSEFMPDTINMFYHGLDMLDRLNSRRHRGTVTIPMRPELRLGFPVYIAPKDQVWYVAGISHSLQFGGRASTTLQLTAKRSKCIPPRGIAKLKFGPFSGKSEPPKDGAPSPDRISARELSNNAKFELDMGDALEMPADQSVYAGKSGSENPAEPLILRHPKTGRIVGYPSLVLVYTRPFAKSDISAQAGQKSGFGNPFIAKPKAAEFRGRREIHDSEQADQFTANRSDVLLGKYLNNTYQYGLNSAGRFVYARDTAGVIREMLTLQSANLTVKGSDDVDKSIHDAGLANPTVFVRPVSDERGFELVGHYQYGRKVSLKDGNLIVGDSSKVRIGLQLALTGDLGAALTAQSQGLVTTGYPDPAATLATLTPDERDANWLGGGDSSQPSTKAAEFTEGKRVDVAPLGSEQQKGTQASVEATQLSRALTLAEMAVQDVQGRQDDDCVCLAGRGDLAFMSADYQVKVLSGNAAQDSSTLAVQSAADLNLGRGIQTGATQAAVANVIRLEAELETLERVAREAGAAVLESGGEPADRQRLTAAQTAVRDWQSKLVDARRALNEERAKYGSSNSIFTRTNSETVSRVEEFLIDLYSTLDDAHQELESALRGDLLPKTDANFTNLNAPVTNPPSEFAPPFSAPNRFMLGDPNASVGSAQTNVQNIAKAWSEFGGNLKESSEKRSLSTQISQDKASIARLTATRDQLIKQRDSSTAVVGIDVQKQIDSITSQIGGLQQQLANNLAKLNTMP